MHHCLLTITVSTLLLAEIWSGSFDSTNAVNWLVLQEVFLKMSLLIAIFGLNSPNKFIILSDLNADILNDDLCASLKISS
jgi:hypothetical protein